MIIVYVPNEGIIYDYTEVKHDSMKYLPEQ